MNINSETSSVLQDTDALRRKSLETLSLAKSLRDNGERINDLLSDFKEGFAKGWGVAVSTCFRDALDIKQTDKVIYGKKNRVWTQGSTFSFSQGDILYDTPQAYERWETALQSISVAYQVLAGVPSRPRKEIVLFRRNPSFNGSLNDGSKANLKRRESVFKAISTDWVELEKINSNVLAATNSGVSTDTLQKLCDLGALEKKVELIEPRFPGYIRYQIMFPEVDKLKLCVQREITTSQDEFISLLITGRDQPA